MGVVGLRAASRRISNWAEAGASGVGATQAYKTFQHGGFLISFSFAIPSRRVW